MGNAIRWSPEQLAECRRQLESRRPTSELQKRDDARKRFRALGRLPKDRMNKTEAAYAQLLEEQSRIGQILGYRFHPMNVRLADHTFCEVDFLVLKSTLALEIHEVKDGYTTEKGRSKSSCAQKRCLGFDF